MIQIYRQIDEDGFFIEDVLAEVVTEVTNDLIEVPVPEGLFKPQWDGQQWIDAEAFKADVAAKARAIGLVTSMATQVRGELAGGADPYAAASWSNKADRARRYKEGRASRADRDVLELEANLRGRGESPGDLAQRQLEKEAQLASAISMVDGMVSKTIDALESAEVSAIGGILNSATAEATGMLEDIFGSVPASFVDSLT